MSYDNDNLNNDSNDFGRSGTRGARASDPTWGNDSSTDTAFSHSTLGGQGGQPNRSQTQGQNQDSDTFGNTGSGRGLGNQGSGNATYAGDTRNADALSGGQRGGANQWEDGSQFLPSTGAVRTGAGVGRDGGNDWDNDTSDQYNKSGTGTGKPSMGQRLKGNVEKAAGKVSGRQDMVDRGQERKTNDQFGDNY